MTEARVVHAWAEYRSAVEEFLQEKSVPAQILPMLLGGLDMANKGLLERVGVHFEEPSAPVRLE
jgi:hypothetical protein